MIWVKPDEQFVEKTAEQLLEERVEVLEKHLKILEAYAHGIYNNLQNSEIIRANQGVEIVTLKMRITALEKKIQSTEEETE